MNRPGIQALKRRIESGEVKRIATDRVPLPIAIERAAEHVFERKTIVPVHELTAEILRQSYGQHPPGAIKEAVIGGATMPPSFTPMAR